MSVKNIVKSMTIEEKIGQKIMLDFRYWNQSGQAGNAMTVPNTEIASIVSDNAIGGVILFSENLQHTCQIKVLTAWYASMVTKHGARLFIATDNEGGNVFRLPRGEYPSFPGNMALAAAVQGAECSTLAFEQGQRMANDMMALHINTNFAPVVDVNTNPYNPVINVRAFGDDVDLVMELAEQLTSGMRSEGLITTYKHFPGHGAASVDSHKALPTVNRSRDEAFEIDLAPYCKAVAKGVAPDMVMTAHIQYPSLDDSVITDKNGDRITVPATMSHEIQTQILRKQFRFHGVTISDALDMGAVAEHFDQEMAIEHVFRAGVDIALMPVSIYQESDAYLLPQLIKAVADKVRSGSLSEDEITVSVERILRLKAARSLMGGRSTVLPNKIHSTDVEKQISDASIVLLRNQGDKLPVTERNTKFFILTSLREQGEGIATTLEDNGYGNVAIAQMGDKNIEEGIGLCDVLVIGISTASLDMNNSDVPQIRNFMRTAHDMGKTAVYVSLRISYDHAYYLDGVPGCALATYSYYGLDEGIWRGPSMKSLAEILIGKLTPVGKLPVNTWRTYDARANVGAVAAPYVKGYGMSWEFSRDSSLQRG